MNGTDINLSAYNAQSPQNSAAPFTPISMPEPNIPAVEAMPPPPTVPAQLSVIYLTPLYLNPKSDGTTGMFHDSEYDEFEVKKGPLDCSEELAAVGGWEPLTHPEGALFFYQPYKRVFTDADVRDPDTAVKIDQAVKMAYEEVRRANVPLDPSVELALELIVEEDVEYWGYYLADHERRVIFWFEDHKSFSLMHNVRGAKRKSHVKYALESQYWRHIELFPNKRFLPEGVGVELKELVLLAHADLLKGESFPDAGGSIYETSLRSKVCEPGARLDLDRSLYGEYNARSKEILRVMNVVLFGSLDTHSRAIHRIWVDGTIVQSRWKNFIDRLATEWNTYAIFSTVVLAVNISFLAVPSVAGQTSAILLTYLSTICTIGSLVVTLCLVGPVNDSLRGSAADMASFMVGTSRSMLGLESLALMLSTPPALLMWSMIFFAAALSVVIFGTSSIGALSIACPVWAAVFVFATWPALAANDINISHLRIWIIEQVLPQAGVPIISHV
ncbi:hypothetical protein EDB19DRAFT_2025672 [Suillus lakei]|nr:hypothetical protein EDB19DRAFT_2025672 [Suillus lakei]